MDFTYYQVKVRQGVEKERSGNAQTIRRISQRLMLPYYTQATMLYLYHRYAARHGETGSEDVLLSVVTLAMKMEETVKRLRDVQQAMRDCEPDAKTVADQRDHIMNNERKILESIQFDLVIHHPHRFLVCLMRFELQASRKMGEMAWKVLCDSYDSNVCIRYPPQVIALACISIAFHKHRETPPPRLADSKWLHKFHCGLAPIKGNQLRQLKNIILTPLLWYLDCSTAILDAFVASNPTDWTSIRDSFQINSFQ